MLSLRSLCGRDYSQSHKKEEAEDFPYQKGLLPAYEPMMLYSSDRPLRYKVQQKVRGLLFGSSRLVCLGRVCPSTSMGQPGRIRLPPFCLIRQVLNSDESQNLKVMLVAPSWPQAEWFPDLLSLLTAVLRKITPLGTIYFVNLM